MWRRVHNNDCRQFELSWLRTEFCWIFKSTSASWQVFRLDWVEQTWSEHLKHLQKCCCWFLYWKRGVYLPVRLCCSKSVATLLTFTISGLTHEYYTTLLTFRDFGKHGELEPASCHEESRSTSDHYETDQPDPAICYSPKYSKLLAFFVWNGIVVFMERPVSRLFPFKFLGRSLPLPVVSTLVLLPALPLVHWFVGEWVLGGFFEGLSLGFWRIVKMN